MKTVYTDDAGIGLANDGMGFYAMLEKGGYATNEIAVEESMIKNTSGCIEGEVWIDNELGIKPVTVIEKVEDFQRVVVEETVTISKAEYERLLEDSEFLSCLEAAGVDNWEGYSYAHEMMNEGEEE